MTHGGQRPGSGRPIGSKSKKTLEQEALQDYIFSELKLQKKDIVKALLEKGKSGDVSAIRELLDRTLGKVKSELEMSGKEENPLIIQMVNYADTKVLPE